MVLMTSAIPAVSNMLLSPYGFPAQVSWMPYEQLRPAHPHCVGHHLLPLNGAPLLLSDSGKVVTWEPFTL